jgi:hypothetical protein
MTRVGSTAILYLVPSFGNLSVSTENTLISSPISDDTFVSSFFINLHGPQSSALKETTTMEFPHCKSISSKFLNLIAAKSEVGEDASIPVTVFQNFGRRCPSLPSIDLDFEEIRLMWYPRLLTLGAIGICTKAPAGNKAVQKRCCNRTTALQLTEHIQVEFHNFEFHISDFQTSDFKSDVSLSFYGLDWAVFREFFNRFVINHQKYV